MLLYKIKKILSTYIVGGIFIEKSSIFIIKSMCRYIDNKYKICYILDIDRLACRGIHAG